MAPKTGERAALGVKNAYEPGKLLKTASIGDTNAYGSKKQANELL
jgi:hypothetical protein